MLIKGEILQYALSSTLFCNFLVIQMTLVCYLHATRPVACSSERLNSFAKCMQVEKASLVLFGEFWHMEEFP